MDQGKLRSQASTLELADSFFNCSSAYLEQKIGACGSQQRVGPRVRAPCAATLVVFETGDRTILEGIHRGDQPGKSGWISGSAQTGHVG